MYVLMELFGALILGSEFIAGGLSVFSPAARCNVMITVAAFSELPMLGGITIRFMWLVLQDFKTKDLMLRYSQQSSNLKSSRTKFFHLCPCLDRFVQGYARGLLKSSSLGFTLTKRIGLPLMLAGGLLVSFVWISNLGTVDPLWWEDACSIQFKVMASVLAPIWIFSVGLMLVIPRFVSINDGFRMVTEFKVLLIQGLCFIVVLFFCLVTSLSLPGTPQWEFPYLGGMTSILLLIGFVITQTWYPIYLSYAQNNSQQQEAQSAVATKSIAKGLLTSHTTFGDMQLLLAMLEIPKGRQLFAKFLESEFALENLLFHEECQNFKKRAAAERAGDADEAELQELARTIRDNFLMDGALYCVNISHPVRVKTLAGLAAGARLTQDVFESARQEVFTLMMRDSFSRFKVSQAFKELSQEIESL
eukprot:TRINITY_DN5958_c0_g1_i10.p1 TRINITY_DN5958_c0_g1~~TRINITY_DN5958_c0_g1_i10.p1  ORF type:complete len:418 (-),score=106.22 TRINITY_DN5958_c0_g1_i10:1506-2759(-)